MYKWYNSYRSVTEGKNPVQTALVMYMPLQEICATLDDRPQFAGLHAPVYSCKLLTQYVITALLSSGKHNTPRRIGIVEL